MKKKANEHTHKHRSEQKERQQTGRKNHSDLGGGLELPVDVGGRQGGDDGALVGERVDAGDGRRGEGLELRGRRAAVAARGGGGGPRGARRARDGALPPREVLLLAALLADRDRVVHALPAVRLRREALRHTLVRTALSAALAHRPAVHASVLTHSTRSHARCRTASQSLTRRCGLHLKRGEEAHLNKKGEGRNGGD